MRHQIRGEKSPYFRNTKNLAAIMNSPKLIFLQLAYLRQNQGVFDSSSVYRGSCRNSKHNFSTAQRLKR